MTTNETARSFQITSYQGAELGTYPGATPEEAIVAMQIDAGAGDDGDATWTSDRHAFRRGGYDLLVVEAAA